MVRAKTTSHARTMSRARTIRHTAFATVAMMALSLGAANADTYYFRDVLRPNGHERSMAAKFADGRACGATAGHTFSNVPAFETCMRARGWVFDHYKADPPTSRVAAGRAAPGGGRSSYIDPDTGMVCQNFGGIAVCDPPQGTVRYYNPEQGLNCQRTGLMAICSNW